LNDLAFGHLGPMTLASRHFGTSVQVSIRHLALVLKCPDSLDPRHTLAALRCFGTSAHTFLHCTRVTFSRMPLRQTVIQKCSIVLWCSIIKLT